MVEDVGLKQSRYTQIGIKVVCEVSFLSGKGFSLVFVHRIVAFMVENHIKVNNGVGNFN